MEKFHLCGSAAIHGSQTRKIRKTCQQAVSRGKRAASVLLI